MKILEEIRENEPFNVELTDEEVNVLVSIGLKIQKGSKQVKKDVNTQTYDLDNPEVNNLVQLGFNKVIKDALNKLENTTME